MRINQPAKNAIEEDLRRRLRMDSMNQEFIKYAVDTTRTRASDDVNISIEDVFRLNDHFRVWKEGDKATSADLILSGTVPIMDVNICIENGTRLFDPHDRVPHNGTNDIEVRVRLSDDAVEASKSIKIPDGKVLTCAIIAMRVVGVDLYHVGEMGIDQYGNFKISHLVQISNGEVDVMPDVDDDAYYKWMEWIGGLMCIWNLVQIALLHPQIKAIIGEPRRTPAGTSRPGKKKKKRSTKYIRKYRITSDKTQQIILSSTATGSTGRSFTRRTLAWYVIGHYRHYKNGNVRWINGHWKGALRDLHMNLDAGRDREIAAG